MYSILQGRTVRARQGETFVIENRIRCCVPKLFIESTPTVRDVASGAMVTSKLSPLVCREHLSSCLASCPKRRRVHDQESHQRLRNSRPLMGDEYRAQPSNLVRGRGFNSAVGQDSLSFIAQRNSESCSLDYSIPYCAHHWCINIVCDIKNATFLSVFDFVLPY